MTRIGPYELLSVLGDGGMGTVHKARDPRFDREVAVKLLHPQLARDREVVARFKTEAVVQAKLQHPHIVNVLDFVEDGDVLAIISEYVAGGSLDGLLRSEWRRLPIRPIVTVCRQVLSALSHAHGAGVVHRDVKPSNILVDQRDARRFAKVTDFGIAKVIGTDKLRTATSAKLGTLQYMSPEQVKSPKFVDPRSDLYSLGVVLFEMLTGQLPFGGDTEFETMQQVVSAAPPRPSDCAARIPETLDAIVQRALAKDPAERFQSAEEFDEALEIVEKKVRSKPAATTVAPPPPQVVVETVVEEREKRVPVTPDWMRPLGLIAAVALLSLVVALKSALGDKDSLQRAVSALESEKQSLSSRLGTAEAQLGAALLEKGQAQAQLRAANLAQARAKPVEWVSGRVRNTTADSRVINDWSNTFRKGSVRYLSWKLDLRNNLYGLEDADYTLWVRFVEPDGSTNRNPKVSPPGFTYKEDLRANQRWDVLQPGSGWGNSTGGSYGVGLHRIDFHLQRQGEAVRRLIGSIPFRIVE